MSKYYKKRKCKIVYSSKSYYLSKYIFLLAHFIFIFETYIPLDSKLNIPFENTRHIFTFWEPHHKIPGYLRLCIETWKKFLPGYEVIILDYNNIKSYLEESLLSSILCKTMSLPIQADAIRVAVLKKYGGIWMDIDTILLNSKFLLKLNNFDLVMFGDTKNKTQNIGFIYAKTNSSIMNEWLERIIHNVKLYKETVMSKRNNDAFDWKYNLEKVNSWNYLGNGIIDPLLNNTNDTKFLRLDKYKMNVFPEIQYFENTLLDYILMYKQFYFQKGDPKKMVNNSEGVLLLHNSWTPEKYKLMNKKRFLKQDILLSKLLAQILNISI